MKTFYIFTSPMKGMQAVKQGWSWPGFFFGWIWMMVKGMWMTFAFTMLAIFILISIIPEPTSRVLVLIVGIIVGIFGNEWRVKELSRKGFIHVDTKQARTPDEALSLFLNNKRDN
jgi:hypothetical protein